MYIVVAYASKCGSTAEVAQRVGTKLRSQGYEVEVADVGKLKKLPECDAVVLGTAIRMGRPLGGMRRFVSRNLERLRSVPVAAFSLGMTLRDDTPENRAAAVSCIGPLAERCGARSVATFAGAVFPNKLPFPFSKAAENPDGALAAGDRRDWDAIEKWVGGLSSALAAPVAA
jgi:menaquinone-dependent protoporphyrinogen oxidase